MNVGFLTWGLLEFIFKSPARNPALKPSFLEMLRLQGLLG